MYFKIIIIIKIIMIIILLSISIARPKIVHFLRLKIKFSSWSSLIFHDSNLTLIWSNHFNHFYFQTIFKNTRMCRLPLIQVWQNSNLFSTYLFPFQTSFFFFKNASSILFYINFNTKYTSAIFKNARSEYLHFSPIRTASQNN